MYEGRAPAAVTQTDYCTSRANLSPYTLYILQLYKNYAVAFPQYISRLCKDDLNNAKKLDNAVSLNTTTLCKFSVSNLV